MHAANLKESTRRMLWNEAVNYSNGTVTITNSRTPSSYPYKLFKKNKQVGQASATFGAPRGGTTAVVVEPDDVAHTVHFVFNTAVASSSGELRTFKEVLELEDQVEKERWMKSVANEAENCIQLV